MKAWIAAFAICGVSLTAAAAPMMTCKGHEIYEGDQTGNGTFRPSGMEVEIFASPAGKYGYEAKYTSAGGTATETDVEVSLSLPQDQSDLDEITALMLPQVKWDDVVQVRIGNVGVKANRQDAGGFMLFELLDVNDEILGKVALAGWSFGRCQ